MVQTTRRGESTTYSHCAAHFEPGVAQDIVLDGPWFRDSEGRYVLFRGVNFGARSKLPPHLPLVPLELRTLSPRVIQRYRQELHDAGPQLDLLAEIGCNFVRLPVLWKSLEPVPNPEPWRLLPEAEPTLLLLADLLDELYARGIFAVLDFHQDSVHELCSGEGFPDWAVPHSGRSLPVKENALSTDPLWGTNYYSIPWPLRLFGMGKSSVLVRRTLRAFWQNDLFCDSDQAHIAVRTHQVQTIGAAARFFRALRNGHGHPAILGYEPFNEPHQAGLDKRQFEEHILPTYYREVLAAIREPAGGLVGDEAAVVFIEPRMDWTTFPANGHEFQYLHFTKTPVSFLPRAWTACLGHHDKRVVFSFHYYDPWMLVAAGLPLFLHGVDMHRRGKEWLTLFGTLRKAATERGLVPFLTEFGAHQDWANFKTDLRPEIYYHNQLRAYMDLQYQQVETHLLNSAYWTFDLYNTVMSGDNWNGENFSLLGPGRTPRHLDIVARPYPMRSSAEPTALSFDLGTKQCILILRGQPVDAPTVIFVPASIHYADGFEVRATSARMQWDADRQLLLWWPAPTERRHQLILCPLQRFTASALPPAAQELLPRMGLYLRWSGVRQAGWREERNDAGDDQRSVHRHP